MTMDRRFPGNDYILAHFNRYFHPLLYIYMYNQKILRPVMFPPTVHEEIELVNELNALDCYPC